MFQYQVSYGAAVRRAFDNYATFSGRASRSEYWWFYLFYFVVFFSLYVGGLILMITCEYDHQALMIIGIILMIIAGLFNLACILPNLSLTFRRLHDTGRSGWNWCWSFVPLVGPIMLLIFLIQPSQMYENAYGPVPNLRL